jgi:hypothetical protein
MMSTPGYVYLCAGGDTASLVIVELSLLESVPSGWFAQTFGRASGHARPAPLPEPFRGLPVYGVPTTADILREIIFLLRFPQRLAKAKNKVPPSLEATVDLDLWKLSLEYFGFNEWNVITDEKAEDEEGEETKRAAKRTRLEGKMSPQRIAHLQALAAVLGKQIREKHPEWDSFAAGATHDIICQYHAPFDGAANVENKVVVAGRHLWTAPQLNQMTAIEYDFFEPLLSQALAPARSVAKRTNRYGMAKEPTDLYHWPAKLFGAVVAAGEEHVIVSLLVSHETKEDKS